MGTMDVVSVSFLALIRYIIYAIILILSLFGAEYIAIGYLIVFLNFIIIGSLILSIPLNLNISRSLYSVLFRSIIAYFIISVLSFAIIYYKVGLISRGDLIYSFYDSLYFSLSMWTALGYGEVLPTESYRMLSSLEALIGLIMLPIVAAYLWIYCQDRMHDRSVAQDTSPMKLELDTLNGVVRAVEDESVLNNRLKQFNLNNCIKCSSDKLQIIKYYDIFGRLEPLPSFVVKCECGNMSKVKPNTFLVVSNWNSMNK